MKKRSTAAAEPSKIRLIDRRRNTLLAATDLTHNPRFVDFFTQRAFVICIGSSDVANPSGWH